MDISNIPGRELFTRLLPEYVEQALAFSSLDIDQGTRDQLFAEGRTKFEDMVSRIADCPETSWDSMPAEAKVTWACAAAAERGLIAPLGIPHDLGDGRAADPQ